MIYIKKHVSKELSDVEDKSKSIYHSKNALCVFIFKNREQETVYQECQS